MSEEINVSQHEDPIQTYQDTLQHLIAKAAEEKAKFPVMVTAMNARGDSWVAIATIRGRQYEFKHRAANAEIKLAFPIAMVATDAAGDIVASIRVSIAKTGGADERRN